MRGLRILAALGLSAAVVSGPGCRDNQNKDEQASDDFKDLVVLQVNPADGSTNVFRDDDIVITFSAPVDVNSINTTTIQIRDANGGTPLGTFIVEYERVKFRPLTPPALLANTGYTVFLPSWPSVPTVMSLESTPLMGYAATVRMPSNFSTGAQIRPDITCPFVTAINPPQFITDPFMPVPLGATGVPTNSVVSVRFSEAIDPNSVGPSPNVTSDGFGNNATSYAFRLFDMSTTGQDWVPGTIVLRDGQRVLEFDPNTLLYTGTSAISAANGYLKPGTTYRIDLLSDQQVAGGLGIRDLAGNFLALDALCSIPVGASVINGQWNFTLSWTFTTSGTASTPVLDQVTDDFVDEVREEMLPYDVLRVGSDPAQAPPYGQAEWNSLRQGRLVATTVAPYQAVVRPGFPTTPTVIDTNFPWDNSFNPTTQVGWRVQFTLTAANLNFTGAGVLTRFFFQEGVAAGSNNLQTYNNLILRVGHTNQLALGTVNDPNPAINPAAPTFRSSYTLGGNLVTPTTVARISSYSTPTSQTTGGNNYVEIPIAPNFVWDGTNNIVIDIECRGGTGIRSWAAESGATATNRMVYGDVQNPTFNAFGTFNNGGTFTAIPSVLLVFDSQQAVGPANRTAALPPGPPTNQPNGFSKPFSWPATTERGIVDRTGTLVSSYPTVAGTAPPEDMIVYTGLNLTTDAAPEFGNYLFRTFEVRPGAVLNISGNNPCILRATHHIRIGGTVTADGRAGLNGQTAGGIGGVGGPGGGGGGIGGQGVAAGTGGSGTAGVGVDLWAPGTTPFSGVPLPGFGFGGGGTGGSVGASGGGGGYNTPGTAGANVGASIGGGAGGTWGSASIIYLSGGAGGGGGGGGVATSGAGGGGGGGGGGYLQFVSDRNLRFTGLASVTARGGNGGGVLGSTPGGAGAGGAGGAIFMRGLWVTFSRQPIEPGPFFSTALDTAGPLTYGVGGPSPAAGPGGNGGDGRLRLDSLLAGAAAPGQGLATFQPAPVVQNAAGPAVELYNANQATLGAGIGPNYNTTVPSVGRSIWIDTGTADPVYQTALVYFVPNTANAQVRIEALDTDLLGTPTGTPLFVTQALGATSPQSISLSGLNPGSTNSGRLVRFEFTLTATGATAPFVTPDIDRVEIRFQR